ncbi:DNA polymerase beta superfamily protein [Taibaiella soli]|uniref:Nucleotidyltransferase n=1 Tax=Taibaiella soli TaxID=1649169 RepID=A0A2W2B2U4_9BACT|nr:nucleotidyltransferase domain-containing protein [Taibaiella soli]PZF74368.1 nucleotidyltransferase [Taibaiella soli]
MTIQDLKEKKLLLLECVSGSRAYGLATEQSDTDLKGVYYLPREQFFGLQYIPQISNETNDETYYELGRFVELLSKNNPNILELLATSDDCILYKHPLMNALPVRMFLSKLCRETFAGYAATQVKKARGFKKKIVNPVAPERKSIMSFCFIVNDAGSVPLTDWLAENNLKQEHCGLSKIAHTKELYALYHDEKNELHYSGVMSGELANEVSVSSIPKEEPIKAYLFFNKEAYSVYCKDYREYWDWVAKRNENRYALNEAHGKHYDAKNMMHTIRLLQMAEEIGASNTISVKRNNRTELLAIKSGSFEYEDLLEMADDLMGRIDLAFANSALQDTPDMSVIEATLVKMRTELYLR